MNFYHQIGRIKLIVCEHFVYASFPRLGHRLIASPNVHDLLSAKSLQYLKDLRDGSVIQTFLPEKIVAISYLKLKQDEYCRETLWNHTILVPIQDYLRLNYPNFAESHFIQELDKIPKSLKPLEIQ